VNYQRRLLFLSVYLWLLIIGNVDIVQADVVGSNTAVSVESHYSFPQASVDNAVQSFAFMKSGFTLESATTECEFNSVFPVSGTLDLNGGILNLTTDLVLKDPLTLESSGRFNAAGNTIELCESIGSLPASHDTIVTNANIYSNGDLTISGTVKFIGNCVFDGRSNDITLGSDGHIIVGHDSSLELRNMELFGVCCSNVRCMDNSSQLVLNDIRWVGRGDYTFTSGSMIISNVAHFVGPYTFKYDSTLTSTIRTDSTWYFSDVVNFEVGRKDGVFGREPLYMEDITSVLKLENCYWTITSSGMQMTRGDILMDRDVRIEVNSTSTVNGLIVGNGNPDDDLKWQLYPKAAASLENGHLVHKIVKRQNFASENVEMTFQRRGNSQYYATQNIHYHNVDIHNYDESTLVAADGAELFFERCHIFAAPVELYLTITFEDDFTNLLNGNGELRLVRGDYPLISKVKNIGNVIHGIGNVSGPIILQDHLTELSIGLKGAITYDVEMNGGKIILDTDLQLGLDTCLTGSGVVQFSRSDFNIRLRDKHWTGTVQFRGNGGTVRLDGDMHLASQLSFSGDCTINGEGYRMHLHDAADLLVMPNSVLRLRNVVLDGIGESNLRCLNDSGKIVLDSSTLFLSSDYTFSHGSIQFLNYVDFLGTHTFIYTTPMTSTIEKTSAWRLYDGTSIMLGRHSAQNNKEPLSFVDKTSVLDLDGTDFIITASGFRLTRGTLEVSRDIVVDIQSTDSTHGLAVGDSIAAHDFHITWHPGATIRLNRGHFVYENIDPALLEPLVTEARIVLGPQFTWWANENVSIANLTVEFTPLGWGFEIGSGKVVNYKKAHFVLPGNEWIMTAKRYDALTTLLDGDKEIIITTGALLPATLIVGTGNSIRGSGGIVGPIVFSDSDAQLNLGVGGIATDISLGGGRIIAQAPLIFSENRKISGHGVVDLANLFAHIGGQDLHWTSSINWDCTSGLIITRTSLDLSSRWTFSGNSILWGMGNILNLGATGELVVERGSTLIIRDVTLDRVTRDRIRCLDNAGKIIFDGVTWVQDHNCTFSVGTFEIAKYLDMYGEHYTFSYQSPLVSGISDRAKLMLNDHFQFSYAPTTTARNLLVMRGSESKIIMDGATLHSTATGLQLTKGEFKIFSNCTVKSDAIYKNEGIVIGDGVTSANDVTIDIFAKAKLDLASGHLVYKNVG